MDRPCASGRPCGGKGWCYRRPRPAKPSTTKTNTTISTIHRMLITPPNPFAYLYNGIWPRGDSQLPIGREDGRYATEGDSRFSKRRLARRHALQ
jgi:hypothetical protein